MKRKSYVVMLITVLALTGCGKTQRNEKPVEDNVTSQMSNIDHSVTTQIEQEAPAQSEGNDNTAYPPCVMVDNIVYKDTGYVSSMPGCGTMDGEITSTVDGTKIPSENNQSNFGSGYQYQRSSEDHMIVMIEDEQIIFRNIEVDDASIPKEVIHFNAKVKEVTESGMLLVSHISTAEGFTMNGGDFSVPKDNLLDDVQAGDVVTIWFNGMIKETAPAQLGVVYRIQKVE